MLTVSKTSMITLNAVIPKSMLSLSENYDKRFFISFRMKNLGEQERQYGN
jgi:hypothetical protein